MPCYLRIISTIYNKNNMDLELITQYDFIIVSKIWDIGS